MAKLILGVFDDYAGAAAAVEQLRAVNVDSERISLLGKDPDAMRPVVREVTSSEPDKLMTRLGIAGAIGGLLVGLATVMIPATGALLIAGPLLAAISGAAAGSALGVVAGALVHFDVPETEARVYAAHLEQGKVLVAVQTEDSAERGIIEEIFDSNGAIEVDSRAA